MAVTNISTGVSTSAEFIRRISAEALKSPAVKHPYLQALRQGDFPNAQLAFKDFAFQYGLYSSHFTRYLTAVIENLEDTSHKQILQSNLEEEQGDIHDTELELPPEVIASVAGKSHADLFRSFQEALGVDPWQNAAATNSDAGMQWRNAFLPLCESNQYAGVGAIGIGTELIVSHIYSQVLEGLKSHSGLTITQRVFFELHNECDDEHAAQMILVAEELAQDQKARDQIEYGVRMAVNMRSKFWDQMLERARRFPASPSSDNETLTDGGYQASL